MGHKFLAIAAAATFGASCAAASAQPMQVPPPGASACAGCHAGSDSAMPVLAGKSAADIADAMTAFRTGAREATVMNRIAKGFTEAETSAIAAWFARTGGAK